MDLLQKRFGFAASIYSVLFSEGGGRRVGSIIKNITKLQYGCNPSFCQLNGCRGTNPCHKFNNFRHLSDEMLLYFFQGYYITPPIYTFVYILCCFPKEVSGR